MIQRHARERLARCVVSNAIAVSDDGHDPLYHIGHAGLRVSALWRRAAQIEPGVLARHDSTGAARWRIGRARARLRWQIDSAGHDGARAAAARRARTAWEALRGKRGPFPCPAGCAAQRSGGLLSSPANRLDVAPCLAAVVGRGRRVAEQSGHCAGHEPDLSTRHPVPSCRGCGHRVVFRGS